MRLPHIPGVWFKPVEYHGHDSIFINQNADTRAPYTAGVHQIIMAEVVAAQPEPVYRTNDVLVEYQRGGMKGNVAWPGPNVTTNSGGQAGGAIKGVHGFFDGPVPGQQVAIGFGEGYGQSPIILAKYPHQISQKPGFDAIYTTPLTKLGHNAQDVGLGHFIGSYIVLRTVLDLPGNIEMYSPAMIKSESELGFNFETPAQYVVTAESSATINSTGTVKLKSNTGITLESIGALEKMTKGETLKSVLESLIDLIIAMTVMTGVGPSSPPLNASAFSSLKGTLNTILSTSNKNT